MPLHKWEATIFVSGTIDTDDLGIEDPDDDDILDAAVDSMIEDAKNRGYWDDYDIDVKPAETPTEG